MADDEQRDPRGGWQPPHDGDDDLERSDAPPAPGGLTSGDPLWSGGDPAASSPAPSEPGGSGWETPDEAKGVWPPQQPSGGEAAGGWAPPSEGAGGAETAAWPPSESSGPSGGWAPPGQSGGWAPPGGGWAPPPAPSAPWQPAPQASNGKATAALVCGLLGIVFCPIVLSVAALILGYQARSEIDRSHGQQSGRGVATAGIVTGWVGLVIGILLIVFFVLLGITAEQVVEPDTFEFEPAAAVLRG